MLGKGLDCLDPIYVRRVSETGVKRYLRFRCGQCLNCRQYRALEWSLRLDCEARYWNKMCFITLTYDDDSLPTALVQKEAFDDSEVYKNREYPYFEDEENYYIPSVVGSDISAYIKRLRKSIRTKVKYFGVCEYGSKRGRPHIHILLFGLSGESRAEADVISRAWQNRGIVDIEPFYVHTTAVYIAGYVQKKLYGTDKRIYTQPECLRCSQHLGEDYLFDHIDDFDDDHAYIMQNGFKHPLPRQFRKILTKLGVLKKETLDDMAIRQIDEFNEFKASCDARGVDMGEVFDQRFRNAVFKVSKKLTKRFKTGDI